MGSRLWGRTRLKRLSSSSRLKVFHPGSMRGFQEGFFMMEIVMVVMIVVVVVMVMTVVMMVVLLMVVVVLLTW